jgi:uncharacterized damage-inducible protein DinB
MSISRNIAAPIDSIYLTNDGLFAGALAGLSEADLWYRPTESSNPILWIGGHITHVRLLVLKLMGEIHETGWGDLFARGNSVKRSDEYPPVDEVLRVMAEISGKLHARLRAMSDEELLQTASGPAIPNAKTLADQIAFLALHDSYHIGQMGYLRKALGHGQLVG